MNRGFSLIELMVVVAIISALAYIAVPMYTEYFNRSKISQAVEVLKNLNTAAMNIYNEEGIGDTFLYNGVLYDENLQTLDYPPVTGVQFFGPTQTGSINEWAFCVQVADLNFSNYVENTAYSRICSKVKVTNGAFKQYCGRWDANTTDIPVDQLPAECNCSAVLTDTCPA